MWALSARDTEINNQLNEYYGTLLNNLTKLLNPISQNDEAAHKAATIITILRRLFYNS